MGDLADFCGFYGNLLRGKSINKIIMNKDLLLGNTTLSDY